MKRVLVFAPHPDDDLIGCGGSMAKHIRSGAQVAVVYLTSGGAGSSKHPSEALVNIREAEALKAAEKIGLSQTFFLRRPDGYLEYNEDSLVELTSIIRRYQPELVYLPHAGEQHPDHVVTNRLVRECCRRAGGPWFTECQGGRWVVDTILGYEVGTPLVQVNYTEDISDYLELKIEALRMHQSQIEEIYYDDAIRGLNRYRGVMTGGGRYCECFEVLRLGSTR